MEETATVLALKLTVLGQLAGICPACFGPGVEALPNGEPDVMVCVDCNFQHRRHLAASVESTAPTTPSLFIPPDDLEAMRKSMDSKAWDTNSTKRQSSEMVVSKTCCLKILRVQSSDMGRQLLTAKPNAGSLHPTTHSSE